MTAAHAHADTEAFACSQVGGLPLEDVTVLIPTLNERATIAMLLEKLQTLYPGIRVLVVDEESSDGTGEVVCEFSRAYGAGISLLSRTNASDRGLTASVLDGLCRTTSAYFIVMDGDLQHPPEMIRPICELLARGADLTIASRIPYRENQGFHRVFMTLLATCIAKTQLRCRGLHISDPMSGFFGGRTDIVQFLHTRTPRRFERSGYKILFDLLRIGGAEFSIKQLPYQFGIRPEGSSKLRAIHAFYFLRSLFR